MKTHDWIIVYLLTVVMIFGCLSYFVSPKDVEGAKEIIHALIDALGMVLAFKFGVHVATQQAPAPGTITQSIGAPIPAQEAHEPVA